VTAVTSYRDPSVLRVCSLLFSVAMPASHQPSKQASERAEIETIPEYGKQLDVTLMARVAVNMAKQQLTLTLPPFHLCLKFEHSIWAFRVCVRVTQLFVFAIGIDHEHET